MDNTIMTSSSQMSPNLGNPLNPRPISPPAPEPAASTATIESIVSTPLEPELTSNVDLVGQTNADGNVQGHLDVNYQAHDVALATAKGNGHPTNNGFTVTEKQQHVIIDDADEHPEKSPSCCSMLNKLFLALAAVCFALFLCSMAYIVANFERVSPLKVLSLVCLMIGVSELRRRRRRRRRGYTSMCIWSICLYVLKGFTSGRITRVCVRVYSQYESYFEGQTSYVIRACIERKQ